MARAVSTHPRPLERAPDELTLVTSFMLAAAGLAHLSASPAHVAEWWAFGALFVLSAALQLGLALAIVLDPTPRRFTAGVLVNAGLILTWLVSRTTGLPFGPEAGTAEAVGPLDVLTTLIEVAFVAVVLLAAAPAASRRRLRLQVACRAAGVALGVALTLAFAGGIGHD